MSAEERIRRMISEKIETDAQQAFYGTIPGAVMTSTVVVEEKPLNVTEMLRQMEPFVPARTLYPWQRDVMAALLDPKIEKIVFRPRGWR